jgi:hypothetical protein
MLARVVLIIGIIGSIYSFKSVGLFHKKYMVKKSDYEKSRQYRLEAVQTTLHTFKHELESFVGFEQKLREHEELWAVVVADFVDAYLASAEGKAFIGEPGRDKMLLAISNPSREAVAEEQAFLPPSARLPFDEHWLPLLIKEDEVLATVFSAAKRVQSQLKTFLFHWVQPDYDRQVIGLKVEVLSEPLCEWVGDGEDDEDEYLTATPSIPRSLKKQIPVSNFLAAYSQALSKELPNSKKQFPISESRKVTTPAEEQPAPEKKIAAGWNPFHFSLTDEQVGDEYRLLNLGEQICLGKDR